MNIRVPRPLNIVHSNRFIAVVKTLSEQNSYAGTLSRRFICNIFQNSINTSVEYTKRKDKIYSSLYLGAGVLGDGPGHGVLGQLPGQQEEHGGLDLPGGDGGPGDRGQEVRHQRDPPLIEVGQLASLSGDPLEEVVDEAVHDEHGLGGVSGVWVHLLQDLVDADGEKR